jgi:hypothetical protein
MSGSVAVQGDYDETRVEGEVAQFHRQQLARQRWELNGAAVG